MNMEGQKISCDVCLDLIPLVHDRVASDDSTNLVYEHIKTCESCRAEFENTDLPDEKIIDDKKIIKSIKKNLFLTSSVFIVFGALLGVYLSNSMGMFYNFLIMPIVGACGYLVFKNRWYFTPIGIFIISYIWLFLQNIFDGVLSHGFSMEIFTMPMFFSVIYTGLVMLGALIAALIKFGFRKEVIK